MVKSIFDSIRKNINLTYRKFTKREEVNLLESIKLTYPIEFDSEDKKLLEIILTNKLSMCSYNNLVTTLLGCKYIVKQEIEGAFIECGVWRGGNAIIAAHVFSRSKIPRLVYLFDTFTGMTEPSGIDKRILDDSSAIEIYKQQKKETYVNWCYASQAEVKTNFLNAGVSTDNVVFIEGPVEATLLNKSLQNDIKNSKIAFLRLDTDWYSSTKLELELLFPQLSIGGLCVIDDYGHWKGSKQAVDEFFYDRSPFLAYIDNGARFIIKS